MATMKHKTLTPALIGEVQWKEAHVVDTGPTGGLFTYDAAAAEKWDFKQAIGLNEATPATIGQIFSTLGANGATGIRIKRFTDTGPTGNFLDFQTAAGASLFTVGIGGAVTLVHTTASTAGVLFKDATPFFHDYSHATADGNNIFLGLNAGNFTMSPGGGASSLASANIFIGTNAGSLATTALNNVFIGYHAGHDTTTAYDTIMIGFQAGYSNIGAPDNVFIGVQAGQYHTSGNNNTFLGTIAGRNNTTGTLNTFVGDGAGAGATSIGSGGLANTGSNNVFLGNTAGNGNTSGAQNTFMGGQAGNSNTTGDYNVFAGYFTGKSNLSGTNNTILGARGGEYHTTGAHNTLIGYTSGWNLASDLAQYRVTTDTDLVLVGRGATKDNAAALDNAIAIGSLARVTASNQVVLGNASITQTLLRGNVGVGATTTTYRISLGASGDALGFFDDASHYGFVVPYSGSGGMVFDRTTASTGGYHFQYGGVDIVTILDGGYLGIGVTPTAVVHLKAGTAAAGTAPLKFTSGSLLTAPAAGAVEFLTDAFYGTITTGAARKTFAFLESPSFTTPTLGVATGTRLGLGVAADATKALYAVGASGSYTSYYQNTATAGNSYGLLIDAGGNSSDNSLLIRDRAGSATYLQVRGDGAFFLPTIGTTATAANAFIDNAATNQVLRSTSSRRYKTDLWPMTFDQARGVLDLVPVNFRSLAPADDPHRWFQGLVAEDVAERFPQFVHYDAVGRPDGVQYDRVAAVPLLLIVQEHERTIEAMRVRIADLEAGRN
jgi:hypothetical protein